MGRERLFGLVLCLVRRDGIKLFPPAKSSLSHTHTHSKHAWPGVISLLFFILEHVFHRITGHLSWAGAYSVTRLKLERRQWLGSKSIKDTFIHCHPIGKINLLFMTGVAIVKWALVPTLKKDLTQKEDLRSGWHSYSHIPLQQWTMAQNQFWLCLCCLCVTPLSFPCLCCFHHPPNAYRYTEADEQQQQQAAIEQNKKKSAPNKILSSPSFSIHFTISFEWLFSCQNFNPVASRMDIITFSALHLR